MINKFDVMEVDAGIAAYEIVRTNVVPSFERHVLFTLIPMHAKWADRLEFKLHLGKLSVSLRPRIDDLEAGIQNLQNGQKLAIACDRESKDTVVYRTERPTNLEGGLTFERDGEYLKMTIALLDQPLEIHMSERDLLLAIMDLQGVLVDQSERTCCSKGC